MKLIKFINKLILIINMGKKLKIKKVKIQIIKVELVKIKKSSVVVM